MKQNNLRDLYKYAQQNQTKVKRGILYSILNKLFDLAPPVLIGVAIDIVVEGSDSFIGSFGFEDRRQQLIILAFITFVIWGLESIFDYVAAVTWRNIAQDLQHSLRTETFEKTLDLDLSFFENKSSGRLMAILNDDVNQMEQFLNEAANRLIQTATTVIVIGGTFIYISPLVAVFAFIPIPVIIFGSYKFTQRIAERYSKIRNNVESLNAHLSNSITGVLTVKSFNRKDREHKRIDEASKEVKTANYEAIKLSAAFIPIIRIAILFGFTATLLIGGFLALDGQIKVAMYSVMLFITQRLLWPLTELGMIFDVYQKAMASFRRIINLKETKPLINDGDTSLEELKESIRFENLNFEYVSNFPVLKDVNIEIIKGKTTAIVGSTGSGKSTTLAAIVNEINKTRTSNIITVEDPVEFIHTDSKSIVSHREVGKQTQSFAAALKAALREDPDVILVGEMRDLETVSLALTAAETGHLVFGTLHTSGAPSTINRIIDVFPPEQQAQIRAQISTSLKMVVTQRLFKTKDGQGRCGAFEVMKCTAPVQNLIREAKIHQIPSIMQTAVREGMITMEKSIQDLVTSGKIDASAAKAEH